MWLGRSNQDAARRAETAPGGRPFAVLFGCSDSRLAAEIIFDRGLGDLFVVRNAGHVVGAEALGSIEFGVEVLGCPLVVVLGHDSCGAAGAARAAGRVQGDEVVDEHVRLTVELLLDRSRVLAERVAAGQVGVVGLRYRLAEGRTQFVTARGVDVPAGTGS